MMLYETYGRVNVVCNTKNKVPQCISSAVMRNRKRWSAWQYQFGIRTIWCSHYLENHLFATANSMSTGSQNSSEGKILERLLLIVVVYGMLRGGSDEWACIFALHCFNDLSKIMTWRIKLAAMRSHREPDECILPEVRSNQIRAPAHINIVSVNWIKQLSTHRKGRRRKRHGNAWSILCSFDVETVDIAHCLQERYREAAKVVTEVCLFFLVPVSMRVYLKWIQSLHFVQHVRYLNSTFLSGGVSWTACLHGTVDSRACLHGVVVPAVHISCTSMRFVLSLVPWVYFMRENPHFVCTYTLPVWMFGNGSQSLPRYAIWCTWRSVLLAILCCKVQSGTIHT